MNKKANTLTVFPRPISSAKIPFSPFFQRDINH